MYPLHTAGLYPQFPRFNIIMNNCLTGGDLGWGFVHNVCVTRILRETCGTTFELKQN